MENTQQSVLFHVLIEKGQLKQQVYRNCLAAFQLIRKIIDQLEKEYKAYYKNDPRVIPFEHQDQGDFETHLKFAGDILIFTMHTNIFEFSRYHDVMTTNYIREDKSRSYCGIINIYNFLADSFKYNRVNDIGYLIGRIFVNKDNSYFIEGKRELGLLYNNFGKEVLDENAALRIVESAILYTINFDLLTPPYDAQKEVSVAEMQSIMDSCMLKTGKRLGFRFQADKVED